MEKNRLLELAIEGLERQRAALAAEIEALRSEMKGSPARSAKKAKTATRPKRRAKTAAEKRALSRKMKAIWRKKKAAAAKKKG